MKDYPTEVNSFVLSSFPDKEQSLLREHLAIVLQENIKHNLTRITSYDEALKLHIEDSLSAFPEITGAPKGAYADIGSGAGFPGLPLAITTGRNTTLVESVKKKAAILTQIVEALKLDQVVEVYAERSEDLARQKRNSFSVITARALSSLPSLLELASPLLKEGGHLICYKALIDEEEYVSALALESVLGMKLISSRNIFLSDGETKRRILVFQKDKEAEISLPRRNGLAQKRPIDATKLNVSRETFK